MKPPMAVGLILVGIGITGAFGAISGRLAPMIAALFDPTLLTPSKPGYSWLTPITGSSQLGAGNTIKGSNIISKIPSIYNPIVPGLP